LYGTGSVYDGEKKISIKLIQTMEREIHEKKKLSQENEQLHWKIRQSYGATSLDTSSLTTR
jgi:hypothetical protein